MHIQIDFESKTPAYVQIYQEIRKKIIIGAFQKGSKLPSKRTLSADCGVSVATIEHAYALLCDEDFCQTHERSGYYVIYSPETNFPASEIKKYEINQGIDCDFEFETVAFTSFAAGIRRVLSDYGERILRKSPNNGCLELRQAICRYLSRSRNIDVSPQQIVVGSGAEYLYSICIQLIGNDNVIALENPSYDKIRLVYESNGGSCEMLDMDNEGIKVSELEKSAGEILHVTPFNSFPSGITASAQRRNDYLKWAEERNAIIIEDDYDSEFSLTGTAPETLYAMSKSDNVIYVNTFSKTIASSIRAGYMILPLKLVDLYEQKLGFYSCTVPMLEQFFLADYIDSGEFERNINRKRHHMRLESRHTKHP